MASLFKQNDSQFWHARIKIYEASSNSFKWVRKSTGATSKNEAQKIADALELSSQAVKPLAGTTITKEHLEGILRQILASADIQIEGESKDLPNLKEFFTAYLEGIRMKRSKATYQTYRSKHLKIMNWLPDGDLQLDWLSHEKLEEFYMDCLKNTTSRTANQSLNYIGRVLSTAIPKYLTVNPIDYISIANSKSSDKLKRMPLTMKEVEKILSLLESKNTPRANEWIRATILAVSVG